MIGNIISFILGANISLFLYACILAGRNTKEEDENWKKKDIIG